MQKRLSISIFEILLITVLVMFVINNAFAATVPQYASGVGREIDRQVAARLQQDETPAVGVSLFVTTPVDINDFTVANTLARQMQEEVALWFSKAGYTVREIRKGSDVTFDPETGEMLLTRETSKLASTEAKSAAVLVGTYTVTSKNVRFNFRLLETSSQDVMGMSSVTLPMTAELARLIYTPVAGGSIPIEPTVVTRLP